MGGGSSSSSSRSSNNLFDETFIYIQSYMNVLNLKTVTAASASAADKKLKFKLSVEAVTDHDISLKVST